MSLTALWIGVCLYLMGSTMKPVRFSGPRIGNPAGDSELFTAFERYNKEIHISEFTLMYMPHNLLLHVFYRGVCWLGAPSHCASLPLHYNG